MLSQSWTILQYALVMATVWDRFIDLNITMFFLNFWKHVKVLQLNVDKLTILHALLLRNSNLLSSCSSWSNKLNTSKFVVKLYCK